MEVKYTTLVQYGTSDWGTSRVSNHITINSDINGDETEMVFASAVKLPRTWITDRLKRREKETEGEEDEGSNKCIHWSHLLN